MEKGGFKFARLTHHIYYLGVGENFDIRMPTCLNQFRGDRAHGAVIGGEGLIQLRHFPTDGGFRFDQMNLKSLVSQVK
jgi:hypothetical protein